MKIEARPWEPQDLIDDLQSIIDEEPDCYLNTRRSTLCMARDYLKEYFLSPLNDPLTMEELREMEGKPVPVWCDKENGYIFIAATKTEPYNQVWYFNHKGFVHTVLYYSTKFYHHKPEEGTIQ